MDPSAGREQQVKVGGLVVAVAAFALTRVTLLVVADPGASLAAFLTTGLFPLVLGLGLAAFGVSLAVSTFEPWYVNTVALWTVLGTAGMGLVAGLSVLNPMLSGSALGMPAQSSTLVANTLIGGAVGGALIGVQSARNRRQRRVLARQSKQAVVLDRILRDEVINAVTAILGRVDLVENADVSDSESLGAIRRGAQRIHDAVEDVGFLVPSGNGDATALEPTVLEPALREGIAAATERFPDATIETDIVIDKPVRVRANNRLGTIFEQLSAIAVDRHPDGAPHIRASADANGTAARVTVTDDGDPPTDKQIAVLSGGAISEYDDPTIGFGYPIVSFLVDQYGGDVTVDVTDGETQVTVTLPRVRADGTQSRQHGLEPAALRDVTVAALAAGVAMGVVFQTFANTIPVIGSLYGVPSATVGWITHLFHSVVFGVLFAAALRRPSLRDRLDSVSTTVGAAVAFGLALSVIAAGFVMPLWLNAVGVAAPLPRIFPVGVLGHLVWGGTLGGVYRLLR
ncbi:MAG: ATP-binding protein [Haloarculaceae archaeon]